MKLLVFSDLHCDRRAAQSILDRAADVDVVIGAGDFANCRRGIHETIDILQRIERPAVVVAGNAESSEELQAACANWTSAEVLHGSGVTIAGVPFFGLGGAVPETPFGDWSYDLSEEAAAALLEDCPADAILVTHSPPQGIVDVDSAGRNLGSRSIRDAIERAHPRLVVCGHIHASAGHRAAVGETLVINAGPTGLEIEL